MKTLKYLLATMLLLGVCNLTHSQKLSLGIFPEPQEVTISSQTYAPPHGYALRGINNPDADAVRLLKEALPFAKSGKSLPLEIKKLKDKAPEMQRSGAYTLTITKKGITIGIVDDNSLFYAAQTLKQLVKYDEGKKILPLCSIKDYPDVLFRGTVEGFYGQPWSHADRIEQIRFYGRIKLNTYIYGPKDDPYHSSPNWRKPYPAEEAEHIKELAKEAAHNKVNFVWAIHPGQDIQWNQTDSMNILSKFEKMYDLGVRSFAVFFDDISGEGARPEKQAGLLNYIHKEFIRKVSGSFHHIFKPRVIICVPSGITEVEERAVVDAGLQSGASHVYLIEEPVAAAIGAGIDITKPEGHMVVDIGGGTSDIAVISLKGVVESASIKVAGDQFNEAIVKYMRRKHNILIGERTAEQMKMQIGCVFPKDEETTIEIKGRCLMTGLPKTITVTSTEMLEAFEEPVERILEAIHGVLERTPPELVADIANNGIVMTGGGSLVDGFDKLITARTGIHTVVAENAISCVAIGTGKSLDSVHEMNDGTVNLSRRKQMN